MDLLAQNNPTPLGSTTSRVDGNVAPAHAGNPSIKLGLPIEEWLLIYASLAVILISCFLSFRQLALTGLTWDEWADLGIAADYLNHQAFLTQLGEPSQGRLGHLIAYFSFWINGGVDYVAYKTPFVILGMLGGIGLYLFLRRRVRQVVAVVTTALWFSCPFALSAMRAGVTGGDLLVLVTTLAFIPAMYAWVTSERFWPYGALCGVVCGCAVGSKWTSGCLLGAVPLVWLIKYWTERRSIFNAKLWTGLVAQQWIAVLCAVISSPTFILGYPFIKSGLAHAVGFDNVKLMQFGMIRGTAPWYYIPAVLISKLSPIQVFLFAYEALIFGWFLLVPRRKIGMLHVVCLLSMVSVVALAPKGWQNAQYYLVLVPGIMVLSALTLNRWLLSGRQQLRATAVWLMALALVSQMLLTIWLFPDYLLAGRQFGRFFYGQFPGPAINHCQGLPYAFKEARELQMQGGPKTTYLLNSCEWVARHNMEYGPVKPLGTFAMYPENRPSGAHFVIIPTIYDYDADGVDASHRFRKKRELATQNCQETGSGHPDYELWRCPAHTG